MMTGSPLIRCLPDGRTYVADHAGKIYKFNSGAPLMAGMWPTFACGNRRTARQLTYPAIIAALPPFYYEPFGGYAIIQKMDSFGRSVGQSHGYYNSALGGSEYGYSASVWENTAIRTPEYPTAAGNAYKTFAHSVSDRGDIVGYLTAINGSTGSAIAWHDAAYFSGSFYVYLNAPGFSQSYATDVNGAGTAIGYGVSGSKVSVLRWLKSGNAWNSATEIGAPIFEGQAYAYATTDQDRLVGKAKFASFPSYFRAFVTDFAPGAIVENNNIGTLGGNSSEACDMKDESGAVGWAHNSYGRKRAFYLQVGATALQWFNELPPLPGVTPGASQPYNSEAFSVNRYGDVSGYAQNSSGQDRAFQFNPANGGSMIDLTATYAGSSGWILQRAVAINDGGILVGSGTFGGVFSLWTLYRQCQE